MAWPLVISFTLRFMFSLVDIVFAGLIGAEDNADVAAIGLFAPLQLVFIAIWVGLSGGFTAALSQAFGSQDEARVRALKETMRRLLALLVPVLALTGVAVWSVVPYLGLKPSLTSAFRIYATTLVVGMPLTGFWSIYPDSIVKAHQETRTTMIAGLMSSVANISLNALFALVFGWGIFGIALATVVSRLPSLGYAARRAGRLEKARGAQRWTGIETMWAPPLAAILRLAVPGALTFLLGALESGVVNRLLAGLEDATTAIASYAVYDRLLMFALMPASATAIAVVPFVARLLPAGEIGRIRHDLVRGLLLAAGVSVVVTLTLGWLVAGPVVGFLIKSDAAGHSLALGIVRLLPVGALALVPFLVLRPVFEASNRPRLGVLLSLARYLLLAIPLVSLGAWTGPSLGLEPLLAMVLGLILAGLTASLLAARMVWASLRRAAAKAPPAVPYDQMDQSSITNT